MPYHHNRALTENARGLRKNMTKEEKKLWYCFLRSYDPRFLRQKVLKGYIVDFYCAKAALIVELDGSQHYEKSGKENDLKRDRELEALGYEIIRIPNNRLNEQFREVCQHIDIRVRARVDKTGGETE